MYEVIVIGARCAGAPTAMQLARKGYRVLLVDRATFPSDTLSTLVVQIKGGAALNRWGVLDAVLDSNCHINRGCLSCFQGSRPMHITKPISPESPNGIARDAVEDSIWMARLASKVETLAYAMALGSSIWD